MCEGGREKISFLMKMETRMISLKLKEHWENPNFFKKKDNKKTKKHSVKKNSPDRLIRTLIW